MATESYYDNVKADITAIRDTIIQVKELDTSNSNKLANKIEIIHSVFKNQIDIFQSQPHLLDRDIHGFVTTLLDIVQKCYIQHTVDKVKIDLAFSCIYLITKVRGFKNVIRHFPHEVSDVEPVMRMISLENPLDKTNWETKYILLLWLSVLVLIPLDMQRFDALGAVEGKRPLIQRVLEVIKTYLSINLVVSKYPASFLASKFLTRPEIVVPHFDEFITWCISNVKPVPDRCPESETITLQLMALYYIFKIGKRDVIQTQGPRILKAIQTSKLIESKDDNLLKCIMKLVQRIGLSFLRTKVAPWRYQRGKRFIGEMSGSLVGGDCIDMAEDDVDEDNGCAFEELEDVIDVLLTGLRSASTIIRWSAAKGLGRICNRLPKEMAVSVLECILQLFSQRENNSAWHAGCLTLAEMGRRGLILPGDLSRVFSVVKKALVYDEYKGCCSVGSDVRDAACYVCWSFARAYDRETLKPFVNEMASSLIVTSLFDREVNCRRAAAAAFQENVGRQGSFPNGIEIITTIDYQSVGQKKNSFIDLVSFIGKFESYHKPLLQHLVERKVNHWDPEIRLLASESLYHLCLVVSSTTICDLILPSIQEHSQCYDIYARHGALMALAQIIRASRIKCTPLSQTLVIHISGLSEFYSGKKYFNITGSELMKQGFCSLILECSLSQIPMDTPVIQSWLEILKSTIFYVNSITREFGVRCLPHFCNHYLKDKESWTENMFDTILGRIRDMDEGVRCGSFEAMSEFPIQFISDQNRKLFIAMAINYILSEKPNDKSMTEARASAISCVSNFLIKLTVENSSEDMTKPFHEQVIQVYKDCLIRGTNDYTIGSRGDIGFIVRKHSLLGIHDLTVHLLQTRRKCPLSIFSEELLVQILGSVLTLCVTNQEWMRVLASQKFIALIQSLTQSLSISHVPHMKEMLTLLKRCKEKDGKEEKSEEHGQNGDEIVTPADPAACLDTFTQFLQLSHFTRNLWLGLVPSLGGIAIGTCKQGRSSVAKILRQLAKKDEEEKAESYRLIFITLLDLFRENIGSARLSLPFLKTYHFLISGGHLDRLGDGHIKNVISVTWSSIKSTSDAGKKIEGASVMCSCLKYSGCAPYALKFIVLLLCSPMRPVRVSTSDFLQVSLITYGKDIFNGSVSDAEERVERCSTLIQETDWSDSVSKLKDIRGQICLLLNIEPPVRREVEA